MPDHIIGEAHLSKKITLIGACGSGKSTLAAKIYVALKERRLNAELAPEMIRYDLHANGPMRSIWEQYRTRQAQQDMEDAIPASVDYVVSDSGTLTPYFYAVLYANQADERERLVLRDMHRYLLDDLYLRRYDQIFFLEPIASAEFDDGTRYQSRDEVSVLQQHMDLAFRKLYRPGNVHCIGGAVETRLAQVMQAILP